MKAGYSTNSFGDVDPLDALSLLCEQGYASLAITPDRNMLNPFEKTFASEVRVWQHALAKAERRPGRAQGDGELHRPRCPRI